MTVNSITGKTHLSRIMGEVKPTFEELSTVLAQEEACLNYRPLAPISVPDEDGIEILTPGNFLIRRPLCALADLSSLYRSVSQPNVGTCVKTEVDTSDGDGVVSI